MSLPAGGAFRSTRRRISPAVDSLLIALIGLLAWQLVATGELIAKPGATFTTLLGGFSQGWILPHLSATLSAVALSLLIGGLGGLLTGLFLGTHRAWSAVLSPMLVWLYAVPKIVLYPLVLMVLGVNTQSLVFLGAVAAFFPLAIIVLSALQTVNPIYLKVARSLQASPWDVFAKVYAPALRQPLLIGLRMSWSLAFLTVILGEMVAARAGLGMIMFDAYATLNIARMTAVLLFVFLVALIGNLLPWLLERRIQSG